jgi:hypothetical protein
MNRSIPILTLFIFIFASCSEFIEPSLEKQEMHLLAPSDGSETNSYQQTFWWQAVGDAFQYRLQIVTPNFGNIEKLVLDTTVWTDKFTYTLDPGQYQWRVRAENGSSQTVYATSGLTIQPSSLTNQIVQIQAPAHTSYTPTADVRYEWLRLFGATQYRLQVDKNNFADENKLVLNQLTDKLVFTSALPAEGTYQVRVRAENATENSRWSVTRNFTYDVTPPLKVILTAPTNAQTVTKPVVLTWEAITDADKYELFVYKSDGSAIHSSYPQVLTSNSYSFNLGSPGEALTWKVRAIDKAGNKGPYSDTFSFTIQL